MLCVFVKIGASMAKRENIKKPEVAAVFDTYSEEVKPKLMCLRQLIFDVASRAEGVGELEETLKWGQPSYLTTQTKSGSPVRIDQVRSQEGKYAMYFHCQTVLVDTFKEIYPGQLVFEGNRSIIFNEKDKLPVKALSQCISMALTYHLNKRKAVVVPKVSSRRDR